MRRLRILSLSLLTLAPFGALADGNGHIAKPHATPAPLARSAEHGPCTGEGEMARVASLSGDVRALSANGAERALGCDDALNACETVVTGPDGAASLLMGDVLVQLGPGTKAQLSRRPAPEVALERGAARVIDTRAQASERVQIHTPALTASTGLGDAEVATDGERVRACAHDEPLVITARDGAQTIPAGSCLETGSAGIGGMASSPTGPPAVALGDAGSCPFNVAAAPPLLPPVGSPPPGGPDVTPFEPPGRDSCDEPGSGCAAEREIFEDPDPGTGCGFPGSPCAE